jgi:hypothetical protein
VAALFAEFEDVKRDYEGSIPTGAEQRVESFLGSLSARLRMLVPGLAERVAVDEDLAIVARDAVVRSVIRRMSGTTQQVRSESEGIGPFSRTLTYTTDTGGDFPDEDLVLLGLHSPGSGPIGTIRLGVPDWSGSYL